MADAEVIPLGTRGRPGRGSGSAKPSSSARSLAGPAAVRTSPSKKQPPERATPEVAPDEPTTSGQEAAAESAPSDPHGGPPYSKV